MAFPMERQKKFPFLMLKLFANKVSLQPQFIVNLLLAVYIDISFESFLPSIYKFGMVYTLVTHHSE